MEILKEKLELFVLADEIDQVINVLKQVSINIFQTITLL